jgi:RHS repeat-associated protein
VTASRFGGQPIYGFTGAEIDRETDLGLIRMGARWHASRLGRWVSADPLFLAEPDKCLESSLECNLYNYARDNPIDFRDQNGEFALFAAGAFAGAVLEVGVQYFTRDKTKDFKVDWKSVGVSAAAGALGGGLGAGVAKLGQVGVRVGYRVGAAAAGSAVIGGAAEAGNQKAHGQDIDMDKVRNSAAISFAAGGVGAAFGEKFAALARARAAKRLEDLPAATRVRLE